MARAARCNLSLDDNQLRALLTAVDASLNVPTAMSATPRGRHECLARIGGTLVACDASQSSIVKQRVLDAPQGPIKKKRRSGKSNWPSAPAERMALQDRLAERKALGLRPGVGRRRPNDAHASTELRLALLHLARAVAAAAAVDPAALSQPRATIAMIAPQGKLHWTAAKGTQQCIGVEVALHSCGALQLEPQPRSAAKSSSNAMWPGTALIFDSRRGRLHLPRGDWRRTIVFEVQMTSEQTPPPPTAASSSSPATPPRPCQASGGDAVGGGSAAGDAAAGGSAAGSGSRRLKSAIAKHTGDKRPNGKHVMFSDVDGAKYRS